MVGSKVAIGNWGVVVDIDSGPRVSVTVAVRVGTMVGVVVSQ